MTLGEVVAPELAPLLLNLLALVAFVVALGLAVINVYLVQAIANILNATVGKLPGVGGLISGGVRSFESWFVTGWSQAISGLDGEVGRYWHSLGAEVAWVVAEIRAGASLAHTMATVAVGQRTITWLTGHVQTLRHSIAAVEQRIGHLTTSVSRLEKKIEHSARSAIGAAIAAALHPIEGRLHTLERYTYPKVRSIENEIGAIIEPDIASLRAAAQTLENQAIQAYRDASGAWHVVNAEGLAAAIALAVPALGWQFLQCNLLGSTFAGRGCGMWGGLEDVLGLLVDTALILNICELLPVFETVVSDVATPIVVTLTSVGAGLCSGGIGAPDAIPTPALHLPASPSLALSLP